MVSAISASNSAAAAAVGRLTPQEIAFIGTKTYTPTDFRDTAQAIFEGRLGALDWIEQHGFDDGQAAFAEIQAGRVAAPKTNLIG